MPLPLYNDYTAKASKNPKVASQSEVHALPNGQFLVLARDNGFGHGQDESLSVYRHIDVFDLANATDIKGSEYDCEDCAVASAKGKLDEAISPAAYCSFLDFNVNSELGKFGVHNGGDQDSSLLVSGKSLRKDHTCHKGTLTFMRTTLPGAWFFSSPPATCPPPPGCMRENFLQRQVPGDLNSDYVDSP